MNVYSALISAILTFGSVFWQPTCLKERLEKNLKKDISSYVIQVLIYRLLTSCLSANTPIVS